MIRLIILLFLSSILCCHALVRMRIDTIKNNAGGLSIDPVPTPLFYKTNRKVVCIAGNFDFKVVNKSCPLLTNYINYIYSTISKPVYVDVSGPCDLVSFINISIEKACNETPGGSKLYPSSEMDESYKLNVSKTGSVLSAPEVWGAMRGLETFVQLLFRTGSGQIGVYDAVIIDKPRFPHRGLMLDTSRHFLSKERLFESLKLMAMNKLNVFHWHIVDDQSFPYSSYSFPELSRKGAYQAYTRVYSQEDVADVIEFGRRLGIRVMPEFDSPGHTQSWGKGQPGLLTTCYTQGKPNGQYGPVDPSQSKNFDFLKAFFAEVTRVFPEKFLHFGGDEVAFDCWQSNPAIASFMKAQKIASFADLESYYVNRLLQLAAAAQPKGKNLTSVVWQEVFDNKVKVPPKTLIHVWKGHWEAEMNAVTKAGFTAILSSCWYLNYIAYGSDYKPYYQCDPQNFNGTTAQQSLVVGGEACMWGEYVDDSNVISRTWPRASAVAEALWTMPIRKNFKTFQKRVQTLQCRMLKRGFAAEPPNGANSCALPVTP